MKQVLKKGTHSLEVGDKYFLANSVVDWLVCQNAFRKVPKHKYVSVLLIGWLTLAHLETTGSHCTCLKYRLDDKSTLYLDHETRTSLVCQVLKTTTNIYYNINPHFPSPLLEQCKHFHGLWTPVWHVCLDVLLYIGWTYPQPSYHQGNAGIFTVIKLQ